VRLAIALGVALGVFAATGGRVFVGVLILYPLVEYAILKRERIAVPWSDVEAFVADPTKQLVAIQIAGRPHHVSPVVLHAAVWQDLLSALRSNVPDQELQRA
jgi:hypothetical protein